MIKTYNEAVDNLFKNEVVRDYTLDKIIEAVCLLWNPEDDFKIIHVAWTNWKWSVSKMVFSTLKKAWKKVWVFTSPHLIDIRERFETHDWLISEEEFIEIVNRVLELEIELSYFEKCFLISLLYFQRQKCEYVILETWFWGLLDTTNIVNPIITAITSIGYDHTDFLWKTLKEISAQKAWIIKQDIPVVINKHNKVIEDFAKQKNAPILFTSKKIKTNLIGEYQEKNAAIAYEICKYLDLDEKVILDWLIKVKHLWRMQFVNENLLVDWAHNINGLKELKKHIDNNFVWKFDNIYYCFWLKKNKSPELIYKVFWLEKNYIWVDYKSYMLEDLSKYKDLKLLNVREIQKLSKNNKNNLYVVFGSLYMIGEFLK